MSLVNGRGTVKGYEIGPYAKLLDADLRGADLSGADLRHSILTGADFTDAILTNAILTDADLTKCYMIFTDLTGADLTNADLTKATFKRATLVDAILTETNLSNATFSDCDLKNAKINYARLNRTRFENKSNLENANFSKSYIDDSVFGVGIKINNAIFNNATIRNSGFYGLSSINVNFTDAYLFSVDFRNSILKGAKFIGATLRQSLLHNASLSGAFFERTDLANTRLDFATYSPETIFSGVVGMSVSLLFANGKIVPLTSPSFEDLDFSNLQIEDATLSNRTFDNVNLQNTKFVNCSISNSSFWRSNLTDCDFTESSIHKLRFDEETNFESSIYDREKILIARSTVDPSNVKTATDISNKFQGDLYFIGNDFSGLDFSGYSFYRSIFNNVNFDRSNLSGAIFKYAKFKEKSSLAYTICESSVFTHAELTGADFTGANLTDAYFQNAALIQSNLTDANLTGADFTHTNLADSHFTGSNLTDANLTDAYLQNVDLTDANLTDAILTGADLRGVHGFDKAIGYNPRVTFKSYGAMTGPILKLGKPDSPAKAVEFKRRYPAEFERLKGDTGGRDFTESMKESLREKYATPFSWTVTRSRYDSDLQRLSKKPNRVLLLNINLYDQKYSVNELDLLYKLSEVSRRSGHPHANKPLFTIGWVRYDKNDKSKVLLIEEVQSDIEIVRKQLKGDSEELDQLRDAGIDPEDFLEVAELMRPYSDRFYEDAIGLVFQEAEALGYTVEMLPYEAKKKFCYYDERKQKEICPPVSVYIELPKRLGMTARRTSESLPDLPAPVRYYKPNPGKRRK